MISCGIVKYLRVSIVNLLAVREEIVDLFEAAEAHECLQFIHFGVGADVGAGEFAVDGEVAELEQFGLESGIFEDEEATFTRVE